MNSDQVTAELSNNLAETTLKDQDEIYNLIKENKQLEAIDYIKQNKLKKVDCVDQHGTTPLQYAAFRGMLHLCKVLLEKGADVNAKTHDQGYSALMFAAISNHSEVVRLLLKYDADTEYTNVIGRNSAQMASFVNSNESVDVIKAHLPRSSLEYFTVVHSIQEKEPKLPSGECFEELYQLLTSSINYSPIRILKAIKMSKNNVLFENMIKIIKTLNAFIEKEFKGNQCPNDILSYKLHHYKYIFESLRQEKKAAADYVKSLDDKSLTEKTIESCIKYFLTEVVQENKTKCREFEDKFLRESIRQFPYKECGIVKQMVTILAPVKIGQHPSALYVITSCLNGQKFTDDSDGVQNLECTTCYNKSENVKLCTHCRKAAYCDQFCQRMHWPIHKKEVIETKTSI